MFFRRRKKRDANKIIGVCLGWDGYPHICFADGTYLPTKAERILYPEYFTEGDWPTNPVSNEKLPIAEELYN